MIKILPNSNILILPTLLLCTFYCRFISNISLVHEILNFRNPKNNFWVYITLLNILLINSGLFLHFSEFPIRHKKFNCTICFSVLCKAEILNQQIFRNEFFFSFEVNGEYL